MDDELKDMTQKVLANRILEYIERLEFLMSTISSFRGKEMKAEDREHILCEYKDLKTAIRADAHYVGIDRNKNRNDIFYTTISRNLAEAAAWGFISPVNSLINAKLHSSIEEAHYKLSKGYTRDELKLMASN